MCLKEINLSSTALLPQEILATNVLHLLTAVLFLFPLGSVQTAPPISEPALHLKLNRKLGEPSTYEEILTLMLNNSQLVSLERSQFLGCSRFTPSYVS